MSRIAGWGLVVLLLTAVPFALEARVIEVPRDALRLDRALHLAQNGFNLERCELLLNFFRFGFYHSVFKQVILAATACVHCM